MEQKKCIPFHMFDKEGEIIGHYMAVFPYVKFKGEKHYSKRSKIVCMSGHTLTEINDEVKTTHLKSMLEYNVIFAHSLVECLTGDAIEA